MRNVIFTLFLGMACLAQTPSLGGNPEKASEFVLLKNLTVLPGKVAEEAGFILIRDGDSEVRLARDRVACWAPTIAGLHQYLIHTRPGSTLESHLSVARWCLQNNYPDGAVAELIAARRIDPNNESAEQIERELRDWHSRNIAEAKRRVEHEPSIVAASHVVSAASPAMPSDDPQGDQSQGLAEILEQQLAQYTRDIQPVLLNRCSQSGCHGAPSERVFVLERPFKSDARPSASMSRRNLANSLRAIDFDTLEASPLLVKAFQIHGSMLSPPLRQQDRVAAEQLRKWVLGLTRESKRLNGSRGIVGQETGTSNGETAVTASSKASSGNRVVRVPEIEDPFDPEVFNRRFHPNRRDR